MTRPAAWPVAVAGAFVAGAFVAGACAHAPVPRDPTRVISAPIADSSTTVLWHMDETAGEHVADAGPHRIDAFAGRDARTDFGRFGSTRVFTTSVQSFVYAPFDETLETGEALTVEAWVYLDRFGPQEGGPVVARWTEYPNQKSWLLTVVGRKVYLGQNAVPGLGYLADLVAFAPTGRVLFAIQPDEASRPLAWGSTREVELERWTHIAATFDGETVRIYLNGTLDAQYEHRGRIRPSTAPILVGNYFDPRLVDLEGAPQVVGGDLSTIYAFEGMIDEVRISNVARDDYYYVTGR